MSASTPVEQTPAPPPGSAQPDAPAWPWLVAGALAGVLGLFVATWATSALTARASPVEAMAELAIELTPGQAAVAAVEATGSLDKPLLIGGIVLVAVGACAYAGLLRRRSGGLSSGLLAALGVLAGIAVVARDGASLTALAPVALGLMTWLFALTVLTNPLARAEAARRGGAGGAGGAGGGRRRLVAHDGGRRSFLARAGLAVLAATGLGIGSTSAAQDRRQVDRVRRSLTRTLRATADVTRGTVPAGAELPLEGLGPWRVPNQDFYRIDTAIVLPEVRIEDWSLRIHGMVDREVTLSFDDLTSGRFGDAFEDWVTIACVSNPVGGELIGNAWWSGVRIAPILAELGVSADADAVLQTSVDGWNCATPLEALTDDRSALLAYAMNGEPLPVEHGFPVRMIVPGLYGYVSATKWITDIEVTRFDAVEAFWTERGWDERGPIKTMSRIDVPRSGAEVSAGEVGLGGVAWAQGTGIERVEYQLDGGPWREAELGAVPGVDTWVQWSARESVEPGEHDVRVRATDSSGYTQTRVMKDNFPDGATGWDGLSFTAT
ncbi:molybdopterin-dependent oxidoreductase [Nocardioidaceae bacterium]|nr:molybdopterin-dependent oxidoreductase [Nocardioidaceae bacterium]